MEEGEGKVNSLFPGSQSVSRCFKPSQPQRITSGLNTNFSLSKVIQSTSHYTTGLFSSDSSNVIHNFGTQNRKTITHGLEPNHIPWALNTGTCIQRSDLFYSAGLRRNRRQPQLTQEKLGKGFGKNAGERTRRVEISKEEIPGCMCNMHGNKQTCSRLPQQMGSQVLCPQFPTAEMDSLCFQVLFMKTSLCLHD